MNWLIHPIESLKRWRVKRFILGIVNTAIAKYNGDIATARRYVALYIGKVEALLAYLKSLDAKLADGKLTEDEADALCIEAKAMGAALAAKEA